MVATTEVDAGPSPCVLYALATTWYDVNLPRPRSEKPCDGAPEAGRSMNSRPVVRPTALKEKKANLIQWRCDQSGMKEHRRPARAPFVLAIGEFHAKLVKVP